MRSTPRSGRLEAVTTTPRELDAHGRRMLRLRRGWGRLSTRSGVATWDGVQWSTKPLSVDLTTRIAPHAPGADRVVLSNIVELCTHWLGAGRVGATLVWRLDGDPRQLTRL